MITIQQKKQNTFLQGSNFKAEVIDVDTEKRTISAIANTYNYIDFELDMLIMGASATSINNSGPNSEAKAKIQHLKDHTMRTDFVAGKLLNLEETTIDGRQVLRFDSKIVDVSTLMLYQEGIINQHSIGFRYIDIQLADRNGDNEQRRLFDTFLAGAINPEVAEKSGFFYVVKEIELFEVSSVLFGMNNQTETTGIKSKEPDQQKTYLLSQLENLKHNFKNGKFTDDHFRMINLQIKQFEQAIQDLKNPSIKDTLNGPSEKDISQDQDASKLLELIKF